MQPDLRAARVDALVTRLRDMLGDRLDARVNKLNLTGLDGGDLDTRIRTLSQVVLGGEREGDPLPSIENRVAEWDALNRANRALDDMVNEKLKQDERELYDKLRVAILNEKAGPDNARTLYQYARLEAMESVSLGESVNDRVRPADLGEIVGQDDAVKALRLAICSPYPQHVLLYGMPGVGKTSAARLALKAAAQSPFTPFKGDSPFIEVDGSTLGFDRHNASNPLIGSVHDPIYQGATRSLAENGVPEPHIGLVSRAHGGVLFIDEIGEMPEEELTRLLKVLEDKRVRFESSYFDPDDAAVPAHIRKLFLDGAPADFVLVGATSRSPAQMPAALRSRCVEIAFSPLGTRDLKRIVTDAAARIGEVIDPEAAALIALNAADGREAVRLMLLAGGAMTQRLKPRESPRVRKRDAMTAVSAHLKRHTSELPRAALGRVYALGVLGGDGCVVTVESCLTEEGGLWFNGAAGGMARDAVENAAFAVKAMTGYGGGLRVNCLGGGQVDGPSIGLAAALSIYGAVTGKRPAEDIAVTGELALNGDILPVGGVRQKLLAAKRAGLSLALVPEENRREAELSPCAFRCVSRIEEAVAAVFREAGEGAARTVRR